MLGTDCEPGIYIRTLDDLFKALEAATEEMDYRVSMSYLEVKCLCSLDPGSVGIQQAPGSNGKWGAQVCPSHSAPLGLYSSDLPFLPSTPKKYRINSTLFADLRTQC